MVQEKTFLIYRKNPDEESPRYERYIVPVPSGMTVLEALFYIQDHLDSTLAFRYACRGAICGACGMTVNKLPRLACNTQVFMMDDKINPRIPQLIFGKIPKWDKAKEILIEPLPNMKVKKDLVVDMEPFWKFYREVKPFFDRKWNDIAPETHQAHEEVKKFERLIYCILCGVCWTCPVSAKRKDYLGPAALAKGYRFIADTRTSDTHRDHILNRVALDDAVPACEKIFACNLVCPKGVNPGTAIHEARKMLEALK